MKNGYNPTVIIIDDPCPARPISKKAAAKVMKWYLKIKKEGRLKDANTQKNHRR